MNNRRIDPFMMLFLAFMVYAGFRDGMYSASPREWLLTKIYILPGIIIGLAFHEFAHAEVAYRLGDQTPRYQGRLTLNPLAHMDLVGFISLVFIGFGWGKPVEIDPNNFKHRRRDEMLVAFAGVVMNFLLAVAFTLILKWYMGMIGYTTYTLSSWQGTLYYIILYAIQINLVLMIFNLMPVPPLDGWNIITEIFNLRKYNWYWKVYRYGWFILMALIMFNFTDVVLNRGVDFFLGILSHLL
ncbi:MAG: site-2 protease family protein [Eubacteriaceae bacterium]|nr:site-2 protease family protein [Eubacteriaceae bacterium]